jgi:hypothetical protein
MQSQWKVESFWGYRWRQATTVKNDHKQINSGPQKVRKRMEKLLLRFRIASSLLLGCDLMLVYRKARDHVFSLFVGLVMQWKADNGS